LRRQEGKLDTLATSFLPLQAPFSLSFIDIFLDAGQGPSADEASVQDGGGSKYKQIFALRAIHLLAIFALIYIGVEVTLGGQWYSEDGHSDLFFVEG
jgi:fucose permease